MIANNAVIPPIWGGPEPELRQFGFDQPRPPFDQPRPPRQLVSGTQLQLALQFLGLCRQADGDLLEAKRRLPMRAVARQFDAGLRQFA